MKITSAILGMFILTSCGALPNLFQSVEDIANDDAVSVMVSREAINKKKDLNITVDLKNPEVSK